MQIKASVAAELSVKRREVEQLKETLELNTQTLAHRSWRGTRSAQASTSMAGVDTAPGTSSSREFTLSLSRWYLHKTVSP